MAASVPSVDGRPQLRVRGIGAEVRITLEGSKATDLYDLLSHAWSRCQLPAADGESAEVGVSGVAGERASSPVTAESDGIPAYDPRLTATGDPATGAVQPCPELTVTLDPAAGTDVDDHQVSGSDPDAVMVRTTQAITRLLIGEQAGKLLMLHAGAVAHPETGRAVVFVAPGGTGKTTLTRKLAARYGYLSDETVAIDADFRVLPYPKPLSVRRGGAPKHELSPDELGLQPAPAEPTVVRLCVLDREAGIATPEVTEFSLLDAITELTPQTSSLYALPDGLRTLARLITATGPVLRLRYAEADDLIPLVDALLAGDDLPEAFLTGPDTGTVPASQPPVDTGTDQRESGTAPASADAETGEATALDPALRVHALQFADTLERDGEVLLLLREGTLLRLNPLGASIVEFAINPIRLDALATALERRFGVPEGTDLLRATAERVQELAHRGVLTLGDPPLPEGAGPFWRIGDDTAYVLSAPDRVVVFNLATPTEQPEALIGTAASIWQCLLGDDDNPRPWTGEPELIADLAEAYATDSATIAPDVRAFLTQLHATGHLQSGTEAVVAP